MFGWPIMRLVLVPRKDSGWKLGKCMATGTLLTISMKKGVVFIVFKCFDAALRVACEMVVGQEVVNFVHVLGSSLLSHQLPQNECHQDLEVF